MAPFRGFSGGKTRLTPVPAQFFSELLPQIDHLGELKVTLYLIWRLDRLEGAFRYVRRADFAADEQFMGGMGSTRKAAEKLLDEGLKRAVERGSLLYAPLEMANGSENLYFLNTPKGRAGAEAVRQGRWRPSGDPQAPVELGAERPNIYRLYEENIGPLTPLLSEALHEAEDTYPDHWIMEAVRIAVENNKRSWRYVEAILRRWQEEGRDEQNRGNTEKDRRSYFEGKLSDLIDN